MNSGDAAKGVVRRHPLQRLSSPSRGISALVHVTGLISFAFSFRYLVVNPSVVNESYGWHFQYLTILGLTLATATFLFALLADVTLSARLFMVKNALAVASTPLETVVSLLYWGLRTIDPKLVLPDWAPPLDLSTDLGWHFTPAFLLVLDLLFLSPPWTITAAPTALLSTSLAFAYWFWIELCYHHNQFYPYPIFGALSTPWRAVLFAGAAAIMSISTLSLQMLYAAVNGTGPKARPGDGKTE